MTTPNQRSLGGKRRLEANEVERQSIWVLLGWMGAVLAGLFLVFFLVDFFLLRGREVVSFKDVRFEMMERGPRRELSDSPELTFNVERVGDPHTVVISTFPQQLALRWTLTSKEGWPLAQGADLIRTDGPRLIRFVPQTGGAHTLKLERIAGQPDHASVGIAGTSGIDRCEVVVSVNERSIIRRLSQRRSKLSILPGFD